MKERLQEMVLRILRESPGATIGEIRTKMEQWRPAPAHGTIFTTLTRMRRSGYVVSSPGTATPVQGGKAQRHWHLTDLGRIHLHHSPWTLR